MFMASITSLKASDGTGNASVATVQSVRSPLATTLVVDTVQGINSSFHATMGTPHTFVDPVTSETITVISEATAVDFKGHVDGGNLEIDTIAPGFTDNGSAVSDIVIIKPTTQWADQVADVLDVAHNDDGTIKNDAITTKDQFVDSLDPVLRGSETVFDHVASGLVWTGDSYGSTCAASMTAGVVYIGGVRVPVSAVTSRTFTASKDTYIDVGTDGVLDYTEVANNAASPALAASHVRIGIIITGASNIANVGSINQGQEDKVLPIASSVAYCVTDSLGNLICPRDPSRRLLGYRRITGNKAGITTETDITGLSVPFIAPGNRKIKISFQGGGTSSVAGDELAVFIKESTTYLQGGGGRAQAGTPIRVENVLTPSSGLHTYKATASRFSGTGSITIYSGAPSAGAIYGYTFLKVELD